MKHNTFNYKTISDLEKKCSEIGCKIGFSNNIDILKTECEFDRVKFYNRLGIAPMESCDGTESGEPTELTYKKYTNLAKGGASFIWFEAVSIVYDGRSSNSQLFLNKNTLSEFKRLVAHIKEVGLKSNGFEPYVIMQANHSGRYSKPDGTKVPKAVYHNPIYEKNNPIDDSFIVSDEYLLNIEEQFGVVSNLCRDC